MVRRIKVFLSCLFAAVLFCLPVSAEFNSSDSLNLSYIRTDVSTIRSYITNLSDLGFIRSTLDNILNQFTMVNGVTSLLDQIRDSLSVSSTGSFAQQLLQAVQALNKDEVLDFNTENALYCFDSYHYSGDTNATYPGMIRAQGDGQLVIFQSTASRYVNMYLPAGRYLININLSNTGSLQSPIAWRFETNGSVSGNAGMALELAAFELNSVFVNSRRYICYFDVPAGGLYFGDCYALLDHSGGYASAYIYLVQDNSMAGAVDGGFGDVVGGVGDADNQHQQQEEGLWQNVNDYKGDIDFSISDWSEAAAGMSYVTGVFMLIWDNSPTQVIVLSLMLGIAMLAIGRGVQAAIRVSNRRDRGDD